MKKKVRIAIESPCADPSVRFVERGGARFCLACNEVQHDLRDATEREALALFAAHGGRLCGAVRVGPSGEPRFRPERPARGPALARGAVLALTLAACDHDDGTSVTPAPIEGTPPPTTTTTSAAPPPTTSSPPSDPAPDTTSAATSEPDHSTDESTDASDHAQHWHTHPPVHHISGGMRAVHHEPGDPLQELDGL